MPEIKDFPYEEIRDKNGDYFTSWQHAFDNGHPTNRIWSVVETEGTFTYGPPHHYVNLIGFVATKEPHDSNTYYHEKVELDDV